MSASLLVLCTVSFAVSTAAVREGSVQYPCFRAEVAPVIDGQVEGDPAWRCVPSATGFRVLGGGYTHAKQTVARATWDDEAFYVAMVCEEPDAAALKPTIKDWGDTWTEDSVEIFLQPGEDAPVYQFGVTAGGARGAGESMPDITRCPAAARILSDAYSIEIKIPYVVLDCVAPTNGTRWRGTFCRNIFTTLSGGDKFTSWSPLQARFLEPENFAILAFHARTLEPAEAEALTAELNRDYRTTLVGQLRRAASMGAEYEPVLRTAADDESFGADARKLLRQWRRLERLNRNAETAPLPEVRRVLSAMEALVDASNQLKYEYLISKLFREE